MENLVFKGKPITYSNRWCDKDTFSLDAGDGDNLVDSDGDKYHIHIEWHADEHQWIREVWFEDDYLSVDKWKDYDEEMKSEFEKIISLAKLLLNQ